MKRWMPFRILVLTPLMFGTTTIVRENGVEVGRMVEHDGVDQTKTLDQTRMRSDLNRNSQKVLSNAVEEQRGLAAFRLKKERQQDWGLRIGMTRDQANAVAKGLGLVKSSEFSEMDSSPEALRLLSPNTTEGKVLLWVYEYRYQTPHFRHIKRLYFSPDRKLVREEHQADPL